MRTIFGCGCCGSLVVSPATLEQRIRGYSDGFEPTERPEVLAAVAELLSELESGRIRAATRVGERWQAHDWVKLGILLAFRAGELVEYANAGPLHFADKDTLPPRRPGKGVRIVPGGSAVRAGSFVGDGVVVMPPAYVNVGAFVGAGTMIDSHALVGSCAQVGARVHLSAAAQVGGVLEPVGDLPVIIEDEVLVGGNCGLYEGVLVRTRAVIAAGVVLTRSTPVHDCVNGTILRANAHGVLEVPEGAVVVMGSRPASGEFARENGLQIATPLIVKYRDASTDARTALEGALR
jgi:2,3,4,5-tetrahydropyridine-2-carboxylate N-succinyltransferase